MEEQLNRFFDLFLEAINQIHPEYYHTAYNNVYFQEHQNNKHRHFRNGILHRFGERVFSYELYYKLRVLIENERQLNPAFLQNCFLQGELNKYQLGEILDHYNIQALPKNFIPDILMHTPGSMDLNAFIIEIKVAKNLSAAVLRNDILKLSYFINKYRYQRGIFLSLHSNPENIADQLRNSGYLEQVRQLSKETKEKIFLVSQPWANQPLSINLLSEILNYE